LQRREICPSLSSLASNGGEFIGASGTGILNQSGGTNSPLVGELSLGVNSGSSGTYTLSGGTLLSAANIYIGGSSAGPGGTGVLTVSGTGSIAFGGQITVYNTAGSGFNVNGGSVIANALNLMGTYTHTAGNATYGHITGGGQMNVSGGQVTLTDDTTGHLSSVSVSGPATLGFDVGTSSNSQITADTATFTATPTIALSLSGFPDAGTVFTLLSATNFNDNGFLGSLPTQAITIGRDTLTPSLTGGSGAAGAIIVTVSGGPANLTWIGSNNLSFDGGGAWDTLTTNNWENHGNEALTPDVFYAGDHVTFDDTAANFVVDLNSGDVIANSVTFNNSQNTYTVNGFNGIGGTTNVAFAGSNLVTLNNFNSYTGTTTISGGGTVSVVGSIASPTINVTNGTLQLAANSALMGTPAVTLGNGVTTGTLDLDGTQNTVGDLSGGAGNLVTNTNPNQATLYYSGGASTFGGAIQDGGGFGGPVALNVANGSLTLSGANAYSGGTTISGGTLAVDGSITGDVAVNFGGTLAGHGSVGGHGQRQLRRHSFARQWPHRHWHAHAGLVDPEQRLVNRHQIGRRHARQPVRSSGHHRIGHAGRHAGGVADRRLHTASR
jgi:autotransporter-associated beta strand protein